MEKKSSRADICFVRKHNFASSQKKHYKLDGVAAHPGDVGMKHIADCYYAVINAMMEQK